MKRLGFGVVIIAMLLAGCGFQMRGEWQLPAVMQNTVMSGGNQVLYIHLQREFRAASAELSRPQGDVSGAHIIIQHNQMDKRVLSVDSRGKVIEYEIYYDLHFKLLDGTGNQIVPPQKINLTRDYPFVATDVLGASQEEVLLRNDMYRDMARQVMRRIQSQTQ